MTEEETKTATVEEKAETIEAIESDPDFAVLEAMAKEGLIFGRRKRNSNPKMQKYVYTSRNGFEMFDLRLTKEKIEEAQKYVTGIVKTGQTILLVGTDASAYTAIADMGEKYQFPYVVERWLGGTLTNFKTITKRLNFYLKLKSDQEAGMFDKYTKKERTGLDKKIERLTRLFGGLENLKGLPALVVVVGAQAHQIAIQEARKMKIPILAVASTNTDPDLIDVLIPANDKSRSSVEFILKKIDEAIEAGIKARQSVPAVKSAGAKPAGSKPVATKEDK